MLHCTLGAFSGRNFGANQVSSTVTFEGVAAASYTSWSNTSITVKVPSGAETGPFSVTTSGGTATSSGSFTVTTPPPEINSISPPLKKVDEPVTIYGSHFGDTAGSVSFGGHSVGSHNFTASNPGYSWSNTSIGLLIPTSAQPGPVSVTVTTNAGQTSNGCSYTITGDPLPRSEEECEGKDCPEDSERGDGSDDGAEEGTDSEEEGSEDSPEEGG